MVCGALFGGCAIAWVSLGGGAEWVLGVCWLLAQCEGVVRGCAATGYVADPSRGGIGESCVAVAAWLPMGACG